MPAAFEENLMQRNAFLPTVALAAFVFTAPTAFAHDDMHGASLRSLSAQWAQWTLSTPAASNALLDSTGASCMVAQRGPVWFLTHSLSNQPTVRTCTVPDNVELFVPIYADIGVNTPGCEQPDVDLSVAELRSLIAPHIDSAGGISVLLDNRPVDRVQRVRSGVYTMTLPAGNLPEALGTTCLVPGQVYSPGVADGYFVRLHPLLPGPHQLSFRVAFADGFSVDVSYTLNVTRTTTR
jgi:hypothetical protein